jgi:prevent-host-death family protein
MLTASHIKPISYLKANAAQVLRQLAEQREPMVITQNGEATAVLQDIASYEQDQQTLALLKILALGNQQIAQGRTVPAAQAISNIRHRLQSNVQ